MKTGVKYKNISQKTGLFFGSFNPIHVGHLIIAQYFTAFTDLHQLWFVISPQNPLKKKESLLASHHRLNMVKLAIEDNPLLRASDIEFNMPQPSYTINTLTYLSEKYPEKEFVLIMGSDNLATLHKWKNYEDILSHYEIYVYKRPLFSQNPFEKHANIKLFDAPLMQISSSFIRSSLNENKSMKYLLHDKVMTYIDDMLLYKGKRK